MEINLKYCMDGERPCIVKTALEDNPSCFVCGMRKQLGNIEEKILISSCSECLAFNGVHCKINKCSADLDGIPENCPLRLKTITLMLCDYLERWSKKER